MDKDILQLLRCPDTGAELEVHVTQEQDDEILEGALISKTSGRRYPVQEGIAQLLPERSETGGESIARMPEDRAWAACAEEMERRFLIRLFTPFEISAFRNAVELKGEDWMLEVGCGRGRISVSSVPIPHRSVCLDLSLHNLRVCRERIRNQGYRYTSLIQADPSKLPFADESFDKLVSAQLLGHIPTLELRSAVIKEMARVCKEDSRMAVSAFSYDLFASLRKDKTGTHKSGLPYFRFTKTEFRDLLHEAMLIEEITQKLQYVWVGSGVPIKEHSMIIT